MFTFQPLGLYKLQDRWQVLKVHMSGTWRKESICIWNEEKCRDLVRKWRTSVVPGLALGQLCLQRKEERNRGGCTEKPK